MTASAVCELASRGNKCNDVRAKELESISMSSDDGI